MKRYLVLGVVIVVFSFCWYQGYFDGSSSSFTSLEKMRDKKIVEDNLTKEQKIKLDKH